MSLGKGWHQSSWATNSPLRGGSSTLGSPHLLRHNGGGGGGGLDGPARQMHTFEDETKRWCERTQDTGYCSCAKVLSM